MWGLRGPLVQPGSFFGRYYWIEKLAKNGILENISEETEGGKKENFSGGKLRVWDRSPQWFCRAVK